MIELYKLDLRYEQRANDIALNCKSCTRKTLIDYNTNKSTIYITLKNILVRSSANYTLNILFKRKTYKLEFKQVALLYAGRYKNLLVLPEEGDETRLKKLITSDHLFCKITFKNLILLHLKFPN